MSPSQKDAQQLHDEDLGESLAAMKAWTPEQQAASKALLEELLRQQEPVDMSYPFEKFAKKV
jgi:hypothetical protein